MLFIIGTGLWRGDDISVRGAEICKRADKVYLDGYTRHFDGNELTTLEQLTGKRITKLDRHDLEEGLKFLDEAVNEDVALLVPGDPLIATTHTTILMEAKKRGVGFEVVHGSSIHTAIIGEAGLHIYKVGGSCTIPMREKGIRPYSVYEKLAENAKRGLHTIVFLDTTPESEMDIKEALEILQEIEGERKEGICTGQTKIVIGCEMGGGEQKLVYTNVDDAKMLTGMPTPITLIFPGKLHFSEEDFLKTIEYKK